MAIGGHWVSAVHWPVLGRGITPSLRPWGRGLESTINPADLVNCLLWAAGVCVEGESPMKEYPTEKIRNLVLLGHGGTGKTSFAEAALFVSGAVNRLGRVDDGTTVSDFDPDEQKRKVSINASLLPIEWNDHKINIIDAPGYGQAFLFM